MSQTSTAPIPIPKSTEEALDEFNIAIFDTGVSKHLGEEIDVFKAMTRNGESADSSNQGVLLGSRPIPIDMPTIKDLMKRNAHHSTCIHTKVHSTVGLGHVGSTDEEPLTDVDNTLNPLCEESWASTRTQLASDYWQVGNAYLEVIKGDADDQKKITGLHWVPAECVRVFIENKSYDMHYEITGEGYQTERRFAKWGDKEEFLKRIKKGIRDISAISGNANYNDPSRVSEIIHIKSPTSLNRWYGMPEWISAVASIELVNCLLQYRYDFFNNRGVPEFIFLLKGAKLPKKDWDKIEAALKANIGKGNAHKSIALNLDNENVELQLEKLGIDSSEGDGFIQLDSVLGLNIATAHRTPPLLANIIIPGKLGAANELVNALIGFDSLVISPAQHLFFQSLACTLGDTSMSNLGLEPKKFMLRSILSKYDLQALSAMGRMRDEVPGRDPREGLKD